MMMRRYVLTTKHVAEDSAYTKHRAPSFPKNLEINNFQSRSDEALTPNLKVHCPFLSFCGTREAVVTLP